MPLLVLFSSLPGLKGSTCTTAWMIKSCSESVRTGREMSVTINAAHVRLGTNGAFSHSPSLALLVSQKVWYYSTKQTRLEEQVLFVTRKMSNGRESYCSRASGNRRISQPTQPHRHKPHTYRNVTYESQSLKLSAELSDNFCCLCRRKRSNLHR